MSDIDPQVALRLLCGAWFLPHAVLKLLNASKAYKTFESVDLKPGRLFLYVTVAIEFIAAAGLIAGIHVRLAAALGIFVLAGAAYAIVRMNGLSWRWNMQGVEFVTFWAAALVISVW